VPGRFGEICKRQPVLAVVFNPSGPGASLLNEVTERLPVKMEPKPMTARDQANACGRIYDAAMTGQLRQLGDDRLLEMLRKSATRTLVDAWAWDLRHAAGDISGCARSRTRWTGWPLSASQPEPAPPPMVEP
jgi:hypothetical protein